MLAVVIADVAVEGEYQFQRRKAGTSPSELCRLADWLVAEQVEEVVMESTAQYWRPVWATLEQRWRLKRLQEDAGARTGKLHLAQAQSNRGAAGRKKDFPDAERLVKRLVAQELKLSFVPDGEERLWRTIMRRKHQLTRNRVQFQNRLECLLEEAHIKLSSLVSDLLGKSARCCKPLQRARPTRRQSPHWRISGYGPPRSNCAMRSGVSRPTSPLSAASQNGA